jgi:hypothetical protein
VKVRAHLPRLCCAVFVFLAAHGCDGEGRPAPGWSDVPWQPHDLGDSGPHLSAGQACEDEGSQIECGKITEQHGDYVTCSMGYQTCEEGVWSECRGTRFTRKQVASTSGVRTQALGSSTTCPAGFDPCDPYCNQIVDTPGGFSAGPNISNTPSGVTPLPTGVGNCTSLTLTPSTSTLTVTSFTSLPGPVTFTLTAAPAGCADATFPTTWAVDQLDRATMSSSTATNTGGRLTLAVPIAGTLKVTAFAHGTNVSTNIAVKVNVVDEVNTSAKATTLGIPSGLVTTSANTSAFGTPSAPLAGTAATTAGWLYPYASTYFPLGLLAPVIQYNYASGSGKAVKVSLRYPKNSATPAAATFNYSLIVAEANVVSQTASVAANTLDPQVVIPQTAWEYFEETARGNDADILVQRLQTALEVENRRTIHFADGQLKGTVYYNSYSSTLASHNGAVLSIAPGASQPTVAVQPGGKCTVCHSINLDGSTLIANGPGPNSGFGFNQSRRFNLLSYTAAKTPATLTSYANSDPAPADGNEFTPGDYDTNGDRYTYGAPWVSGNVYLTHGGRSSYGGDQNWRSPYDYSKWFRPATHNATGSTPISVTNWPTTVSAVSPRFSPDGTKVAFGFWGSSTTTLRCSSNAVSPCTTSSGNKVLAPLANGQRLVVMDVVSPSNSNSDTGWSVSNARDVTQIASLPATTKFAWPSFTPDGTAVIYQRQYRTSRSLANGGVLTGSWSPSDINTVGGALAELWMSNVPTDGSTTATPTRLQALNGTSSGTNYLPQFARSTNPLSRYDMTLTAGSGSTVYLTGTPTGGPWNVVIDITSSSTQVRGTATFKYSTDGGSSYNASNITTASSVALGTTGLTANFGNTVGYSSTAFYKVVTGVEIVGSTASATSSSVVVAIATAGAAGTAKFRYSTDGGVTYTPLTTPYLSVPSGGGTVALGSTGLSAKFPSSTHSYEVNSRYYTATPQSYHHTNATFTITQADNCGNTGSATGVNDYQLNYLPAVAPTEAGGYNWVVFTSRRMYGNIATDDPWDAEPNESCYSDIPPTKKLWIAAVDKTWTPGTDPSHPAFYLPGQELEAGNSNGYWVNAQCSALGTSCDTDDDCCGGTGSSPTAQCGVVSTATVPPTKQCQAYSSCSAVGEDCTTAADCCTGLVCPDGGGECVSLPSPVYEVQSFTRDYESSCPYGTYVAWRFFEWQSTIPTGTSIDFAVQTRELSTDAWSPTIATHLATSSATTPTGSWERGTSTSGDALTNAGYTAGKYLRVTMTFNPNAAGTSAPTLLNWRQVFDCMPAQ